MPKRKPMPDETEKDWMSYCMADPEMNAEHPDKSERATVCHAHFDKAMMKGAEQADLKNLAELTPEQMSGWWDVTRIGKWVGSDGKGNGATVEITAQKIAEMVEDYNPDLHYAPITVDHQREGPALGYVAAVRAWGDKLQAKIDWAEWGQGAVASRQYLNRSIEMYDPMNFTGRTYLAGFTFLGAGKPGAKGLSPNPALLADGQQVVTIIDETLQLSESPVQEGRPMQDKPLKDRVITWLKEALTSGEITVNAKQEAEAMELKEATEKITSLTEKLALVEKDKETLTAQIVTAQAEVKAMKDAQVKAEKTAQLAGFTAKIDQLVEAGKMVPAERDREISLAEALEGDGLAKHLETTQKVYESRGLKLFEEKTPNDNKRITGKPCRTAAERKRAENATDPEDKRTTLAACELMDADPNLGFTDAVKQVYSAARK